LHRSLSFLLHNNGACRDPLAVRDIKNANFHQIASAQLAIDHEIEQRKIAGTISNLQAHSNRPDIFELERRFLPDELSFVPRFAGWTNASRRSYERLLLLRRALVSQLAQRTLFDPKATVANVRSWCANTKAAVAT
jgi:hypothetical protein